MHTQEIDKPLASIIQSLTQLTHHYQQILKAYDSADTSILSLRTTKLLYRQQGELSMLQNLTNLFKERVEVLQTQLTTSL